MKKKLLKATASFGFTLVELMVALVVASMVTGIIYSTYTVQQRAYSVQDEVAEMQQNLRAALVLMTREIRMAGLDQNLQREAVSKIILAKPGRLRFTLDLTADGDTEDGNEDISYGFSSADDADDDGIPDDTGKSATFGRETGGAGGYQPIAENIQAVEFNYILSDGSSTTGPDFGKYSHIRAIQITMLARTSAEERQYTNTKEYTTASGKIWGSYNDHYRRRLFVATIYCRNLGM